MSRSALVIGATSMLGRELTSLLRAKGYHIIRCGRSEECELYLDLGADALPAVIQKMWVDVVFHCAAAFGDDSWAGCRLNEKINAAGSYLVAELTVNLNSEMLVYAGSISSYFPPNSPVTSYGSSKARGEDILEWSLVGKEIGFTSLRLPQLYDEVGECCKHQPWFGRIVAYANAGKTLRMPGGAAKRNFLHVRDAAMIMLTVAQKKMQGRFPACVLESESYEAIARQAYEVFGNGGDIEIAHEKKPFREVFIPESQKTYKLLECAPQINMREGLQLIKERGVVNNFGPMDVA